MGINATRALTTKYDAQLSLEEYKHQRFNWFIIDNKKLIILNLKSITHFFLNVNDAIFDIQTNQRFTNKEEIQKLSKK